MAARRPLGRTRSPARGLWCNLCALLAAELLLTSPVRGVASSTSPEESSRNSLQAEQASLPAADPEEPYRPFEGRFQQRRQVWKHDELAWPEQRYGYKRFMAEHPLHPRAPNSEDRSAETTSVSVYINMCLGILLAGLVVDRLLGDDEEARDANLQGAAFIVALPLVLANLWAASIGFEHLAAPERDGESWIMGCRAMAWYLVLAPVFAVFTLIAIMMWLLSKGAKRREEAAERAALDAVQHDDAFAAARQAVVHARNLHKDIEQSTTGLLGEVKVRLALLLLLVLLLCAGGFLSYEVDSTVCVPQVWWASFCFTVATSILLVVSTIGLIVVGVLWDFEPYIINLSRQTQVRLRDSRENTNLRMRNVANAAKGKHKDRTPEDGRDVERWLLRGNEQAVAEEAGASSTRRPLLQEGTEYRACSSLDGPAVV